VRIASKQGNAVLMAESDYEAWTETMYLLSNARTAAELMESVVELEAGRGTVRDLIDPEAAE
jgi:antitoxin YefM